MRIPIVLVAFIGGCAVGAITAGVGSAHAQAKQPAAPAPAPMPMPPNALRYQYHVINMGWSNAENAEQTFNRLGWEGWHVVGQAGSYVTFERSWPAR